MCETVYKGVHNCTSVRLCLCLSLIGRRSGNKSVCGCSIFNKNPAAPVPGIEYNLWPYWVVLLYSKRQFISIFRRNLFSIIRFRSIINPFSCTSRGVNERLEHRLDIMRPKDKTRSYASYGNAELICFPLMMSHRTFAFRTRECLLLRCDVAHLLTECWGIRACHPPEMMKQTELNGKSA